MFYCSHIKITIAYMEKAYVPQVVQVRFGGYLCLIVKVAVGF